MLFLPKEQNKNINWLRIILASLFIFFILILISYLVFEENYKNRIYPGISLGDINLSGLTRLEAEEKIEEKINLLTEAGIDFVYKENKVNLSTIIASEEGDIAYQIIGFDKERTAEQVFNFGRSSNIIKNIKQKILTLKNKRSLNIETDINEKEIEKILNENFGGFEQQGIDAGLTATSSKNWTRRIDFSISQEQTGYKLDFTQAISDLKINLSKLDNSSIKIKAKEDLPNIYKNECLNIEKRAQEISDTAPIKLIYEDKNWLIEKQILATWFKLTKKPNTNVIIDLDNDKINKFLEEIISPEINQKAIDAKFEIKEGKVIEFLTNKDGFKLNIEKTIETLRKSILTKNISTTSDITLIIEKEESKINTEDVNNLGIKEKIGTGHSNFTGSSKSRIHNIITGADAVSGIIIKPDEEFSLMKTLGHINKETGYLQELVIRGNKTIPEYGGGLCQIGTTVFRTALNSGLPITARRNHSYRVSYYEPAGTDATIYDPWPDFRFLNDTPNHILILYRIDGNDIYFDFWGTKDGRIIEQTAPTIYNITKPGATKLIETTDLAVGARRCTERAHNGADAYFDYKVTYPNNEIKEERFKSHYTAWREVCLIGVEELTTEILTNPEKTPTNPEKTPTNPEKTPTSTEETTN